MNTTPQAPAGNTGQQAGDDGEPTVTMRFDPRPESLMWEARLEGTHYVAYDTDPSMALARLRDAVAAARTPTVTPHSLTPREGTSGR